MANDLIFSLELEAIASNIFITIINATLKIYNLSM